MNGSINIFGNVKNKDMVKTLEQEGLIVNGEPSYEVLDTEVFKHIADKLVLEAGITPILHCSGFDAIMEDHTIK